MKRLLKEQFLVSHQFNMMESELALEIGILHSSFSFAISLSRKNKRQEKEKCVSFGFTNQ